MPTLNDYMVDQVANSVVGVGLALAAQLTVTMPAAVKRHNVVVKCDASYSSSTQSGLLQILFGATVVAHKVIHGAGAIDFGGLGHENRNVNEAISAVLQAGAGGITGYVTLTGYSTGPRPGE